MQGQGSVTGRYTVYDISPYGVWTPLFSDTNLLMTSWGFAAARALGFGDSAYKISKMYLEFENTGSAVSEPSFGAADSRTYYDNLVAPKDYLRVDTANPTLQINAAQASSFTSGVDGNQLLFRAQSAGTAGVNGVAFSDAGPSRLYGLALVAAPVNADKTKDVLVTRAYFESGDQVTKQASGQLGVSWTLTFEP
jgi:hypothetical protein